MKKLSTYFFLALFSFSSLSFADDINELEIEGISIGDSLLDYLSKDEIINEIEANKSTYNYLNNDFGEVYLYGNFENYDYLSFFVRQNDKEYIIFSIAGLINYDEKFDVCLLKQKEIENEFSKMFKNAKKVKQNFEFDWDPTGESISQNVQFFFSSGNNVEVNCTKYKKSLKIKNNWSDGLQILINKKEVINWFDNPIN